MIRWGYLIPRAVLLLVAWVIMTFAIDPMLRQVTIWGGQSTFGAKVDLAELETSFTPPGVELTGLTVANAEKPMQNLIEFEQATLKLDAWALASKKFIIEEGTVNGVRWNSSRSESGELEPNTDEASTWEWASIANLKQKAADKSEQWFQEVLQKAQGELDPDSLESVRTAKQIQQEWDERYKTLEKRINDVQERSQQVQRNIKFADENGAKDPLKKIRIYAEAAKEAEALRQEVLAIQRELKQLPPIAQNDFKRIELAKQRDQQRLSQQLELVKLDPDQISEAFLGEELAQHLKQALEWGRWIQENFPDTEPPEPERFRGEEIAFTIENPMPDLLVRLLKVTGELNWQGNQESFQGELRGWTTQPKVHGKPLTLALKTSGPSALTLQASIDQTGEVPRNIVQFQTKLASGDTRTLGNPEQMAIQYAAQSTQLQGQMQLIGQNVSGQIQVVQSPVVLQAMTSDKEKALYQRLLNQSLQGIQHFETNVGFSGTIDDMNWTVESNLGEQISGGMSNALAQAWKAGQAQLQAKADQLLKGELEKLNGSMSQQYQQLTQNLKLNEAGLQKLIPRTANAGGGLDLNKLKSVFR